MRFLIIGICVFVAAFTVGTIVIGDRSFDGVVVDKPYETGLDWDNIRERKAKLGWIVSVGKGPFQTGRNDLFVSIADRNGTALSKARVSVKITRPATSTFDRTYGATELPDGRYHVSIDLAGYGTWNAVVTVVRGNDHTDYTQPLFAERSNSWIDRLDKE